MDTVIYISKLHETAFFGIIERLKGVNPAALNENHAVIVPDRFTLSVEKNVYSSLCNKGSFNISVLTLKRLASEFVSGAKYLSKSGAVMLAGKAVRDVLPQIECFRGSVRFPGFAESVYQEICRFKNSMITPEALLQASENAAGELKFRLHDISVIYKRYEELAFNRYIDTSGYLKLIAENAPSSDYVKNSFFYFAGFDSVTNAERNCFKEIIKNCKGSCFAVSEIGGCLESVKDMLGEAGVKYKTQYISGGEEFSEEIYRGLESGNPAKYFGNFNIKMNVFSDIFDETENAAQDICFAVRQNGLRFRDISVVSCNESAYLYPFEKVFKAYGIPYFVSDSETLSTMPLFKAIISLLDCVIDNCGIRDVIAFIKSGYSGISGEEANCFENYCVKWGIDRSGVMRAFMLTDGKDNLETSEKVRRKFNLYLSTVEKRPLPADNYVSAIRKLTGMLETPENTGNAAKTLLKGGYLDRASYNSQAPERLNRQLDELCGILHGEILSLKEFRDILVSGAQSLKLSIIPVSADCVSCGGIDSARYSGAKYVCVLGAGEGLFPPAEFPEYIISGSGIEKLPGLKGAEGDPRELLLREKENIKRFLSAKRQNLSVSYTSDDSGKEIKPSEYFIKLAKITGIAPGNSLKYALKRENGEYRDCALFLKCAPGLYFPDNMTSVSALETYFSCPRRFFYRYGLFFRERDEAEIEGLDTGNLFHAAVKLYVESYRKGMDTGKLASECFDRAFTDGNYEKFLRAASRSAALGRLKLEFARTCRAVSYQIDNSDFKPLPYLLEAEFGRGGAFPPIGLDTKYKKVSLKGKIDRADVFEHGGKKYIRVIDYKTGKVNYDDAELYSGKKIQLFIYMHALKENGFSPAGLYYFPMRDSFADKENFYRLLGITVNEKLLLSASDKSFDFEKEESAVLEITCGRKKGSKNLSGRKGVDERIEYSVKAAENAVNEILEGNTLPSPDKDSCKNCEFKKTCLESLGEVKIRKFVPCGNYFDKENPDGTEYE